MLPQSAAAHSPSASCDVGPCTHPDWPPQSAASCHLQPPITRPCRTPPLRKPTCHIGCKGSALGNTVCDIKRPFCAVAAHCTILKHTLSIYCTVQTIPCLTKYTAYLLKASLRVCMSMHSTTCALLPSSCHTKPFLQQSAAQSAAHKLHMHVLWPLYGGAFCTITLWAAMQPTAQQTT